MRVGLPPKLASVLRTALPFAMVAAFLLLSVTSLVRKSVTRDESHYLGVGNYLLTHGQRDIPGALLHPPLSAVLHSLPLFFLHIPEELWHENDSDVRGQRLIARERDEHRQRADRVRDHQQGREYVDVIGPAFHDWNRPVQEIV